VQAPPQARNDSDDAQTDTARTVAQQRVLADDRPEAVAQGNLAEKMNNSPRVLQQRALSDAIHNSPRMVAQRHEVDRLFDGTLRPQGDSAMPAEASPVQRNAKTNKTGLPNQLKSGIESLSGMSMDHVKVHYNSDKPAQLQAHAYAQGSEIHLGAGQERHLPHEAWHVVQQAQGRVRPILQTKAGTVNDDPSLEKEADIMGEKAAQFEDDRPAAIAQREFRPTIDNGALVVAQRKITSRLSSGNVAADGQEPVQRSIFLPLGIDTTGTDEMESLTLEEVLSHLSEDGIQVHSMQRRVLERWSTDDDEHIYHALFDLPKMIRDIDLEIAERRQAIDQIPAVERQWQQGLDPQAFAWRKLVSADTDRDLLLGAPRVVIHRDVDAAIDSVRVLNEASDFPVKLHLDDKNDVHAVKVLGAGRETELRSYLAMVGVTNVVLANESATDVREHLRAALKMDHWPKNIHLSIMPLSILRQLDYSKVSNPRGNPFDRYGYQILTVLAERQTKGPTDEREADQQHVVCDIVWANGAVVEHLLHAIHAKGIRLESANLHGICGALTWALRRGDMVVPRGRIESLSPEHRDGPFIPRNDVSIPGGTYVMDHGHVTTIMQEDDASLAFLLNEAEVHTVEMEAYHFVKGLEAMGHLGQIKIVFTVSDVMTSPHENLGNPEPKTSETFIARQRRNRVVMTAFGLPATK
jgi:hypothetical protein